MTNFICVLSWPVKFLYSVSFCRRTNLYLTLTTIQPLLKKTQMQQVCPEELWLFWILLGRKWFVKGNFKVFLFWDMQLSHKKVLVCAAPPRMMSGDGKLFRLRARGAPDSPRNTLPGTYGSPAFTTLDSVLRQNVCALLSYNAETII